MIQILDCNDAALRLWRDGDCIWSPGFARFSKNGFQFGDLAWQQARKSPREVNSRYWSRLSTQPLSPALGPARHTADLVHSHLDSLFSQYTQVQPLILGIPGSMEKNQISLLLGILETLPVQTRAVLHRSALVGACIGQNCAHVELELQQTNVTLVKIKRGIAQACASQILPGKGLLGLMDNIAEDICHEFVQQTRFDPRRRADTEQVLYTQIPKIIDALSDHGETTCSIEGHSARVSNESIEKLGQSFSQELTQLLPDGIAHIALDTTLVRLPGLNFSAPLSMVDPSWIQTAALRVLTESDTSGQLNFQREIPCVEKELETRKTALSRAPNKHKKNREVTHFLINGDARPLSESKTIINGVIVISPQRLRIEEQVIIRLNGQPVFGGVVI